MCTFTQCTRKTDAPWFLYFTYGSAWHSRTTSVADQAFACIVSRRLPWKLTEAAMCNTRNMRLDISSRRCSVHNPSLTKAIYPSTYVM